MFASERNHLLARLREARIMIDCAEKILEREMCDELMEEADLSLAKSDAELGFVPIAGRIVKPAEVPAPPAPAPLPRVAAAPHVDKRRTHDATHDEAIMNLWNKEALTVHQIAARLNLDYGRVRTSVIWLRYNGKIQARYRSRVHQVKHDQLMRMKAL